jgi:hypothetical protein
MPGPADDGPVSVDLDAILAGARVMLGSTQERVHILRALLAAIDQNERVNAAALSHLRRQARTDLGGGAASTSCRP